ncbi:MAG TPA: hypothetical protein PK294_09665 [Ignavibacteria bacterium]|nr:hypothetical protein [Ignavibacteria bacterium]HRB00689.1 hypothetical protein [Ignavibacteria bacterium]
MKNLHLIFRSNLKGFIVLFLALSTLTLYSCGKDGDKSDSVSDKKSEETSEDSKDDDGKSSGDLEMSDDFVLTYQLQGALNGEMTMYRSGKKLKQEMNTDIMGMKSISQVYIIDNFVFTVTEVNGKKMGVKTNIKDYNKKKQTAETITDPKEFENYLADKKVTGSENILGKNCDIYDMGNGTEMSIHNKMYVMRIKSPEFMAVATKFDNSPSFSDDIFEIPEDVNFRSINTGEKNTPGMDQLDSIMKEVEKYKK